MGVDLEEKRKLLLYPAEFQRGPRCEWVLGFARTAVMRALPRGAPRSPPERASGRCKDCGDAGRLKYGVRRSRVMRSGSIRLKYGARMSRVMNTCRRLSMHTCPMRTIWPSFSRKRAQQQQPKTRVFSQYVYHAGLCRVHRCGRALRCAPPWCWRDAGRLKYGARRSG